jgi:hypothetical protein
MYYYSGSNLSTTSNWSTTTDTGITYTIPQGSSYIVGSTYYYYDASAQSITPAMFPNGIGMMHKL